MILEQKTKFTPMPEGTVAATVSAVNDQGMQPVPQQYIEANRKQAEKEGRDPSTVPTSVHKLTIEYKDAAGNVASEWFTASLGAKAKLTARIKSLTGAPPTGKFDLDSLIGIPVTLMIEGGVNSKGYATAKVVAVTRRKAGSPAPAAAPTPNLHGVDISDDDLGL